MTITNNQKNTKDPLIPIKAVIKDIISETEDVKTFKIEPETTIDFLPGQCAMLSVFGVGEAMFSISSPPGKKELDFSIKHIGQVTEALHQAEPRQELGIRGPYGNNFPIEEIKGKNLLFIGGGIGLAPLRPLIYYALENPQQFGNLQLIYGARTPDDLVFKRDLYDNWPEYGNMEIKLSSDVEAPDWNGFVGFVPQYMEKLQPSPENTMAITCGPPIMIKFVLQGLEKLGFPPEQVITTLENRMKCGVGKCGRCNIGEKYVCSHGPVFYLSELQELKGEF